VLKLVVAEWLYELHPKATEGQMSAWLHPMVSNHTLAGVARARGLGGLLRLGRGAEADGTRDQDSPLADLVEALIGAVYLDQGLPAAKKVIRGMLEPPARSRAGAAPPNPKGRLQEWAQGRGLPVPTYRALAQTGPAHLPRFRVEVAVNGAVLAEGEGSSKHAAEVAAAARALQSADLPAPRCPADPCE